MSFRDYLLHGWKLCSINPGTKGPLRKGWNVRANAIDDPSRGPGLAGAGLCHAWSGTCALDVDDYGRAREWLTERGIDLDALLTDRRAVRIDSGRAERAKLLYALPTPLASLKLAPYQLPDEKTGKLKTYHALELRCATADGLTVQDVLPETIHPTTGMPYKWVYGDELFGHWSMLPPVPEALLALWIAELAPVSSAPRVLVAPSGAAAAEIMALMESQDPDADYDTWIKNGQRIHHETQGSPEGFAIWNAWSAKGSKYKDEADLKSHWRSFRSDAKNPVTLDGLRREVVARPSDFPVLEQPPEEREPTDNTRDDGTGLGGLGKGVDTRPATKIRDLLEARLVFVAGQDQYYDMNAKASVWLSDRSVRHLFCPHMPLVVKEDKDGKITKSKPDPVTYLKDSKTKIVVDAVGVHPGAPRLYVEDDRRYVNRYVARQVEPLVPRLQEMEAFNFLWSQMIDPVFQRWLMKFYAHALQKPGIKIRSAPLLFSESTGSGKNTIMRKIPELLFGARWVRTMTGSVLGSNFNDVLGETWWLYLEELRTGDTKSERIAFTKRMNAWITDDTIEIHPKGLKPFDLRNRLQITGSSNFDDAVQLDNNDRRWAVCELGLAMTSRESNDLYAFLESERAPGVLRYIFRSVDLTGFQPSARAEATNSKKVMIRAGLGTWESAIVEKMVNLEPPFDRDVFTLKHAFEYLQGRGPTTVHRLRDVLRRHPFYCKPILRAQSKARLWSWRNHEYWEGATEGMRLTHMETGERANGKWTTDIPVPLMEMSAEPEEIPDSCKGLL